MTGINSTTIRVATLLSMVTLPATGLAQTGPAEPQVISTASTARINIGSRKLGGHMLATVRVGEDGRVRGLQIRENTTDGFEQQLIRVFESAKFRPALDEAGQPIEGSIDMKVELLQSTGNNPKPIAANTDPSRTDAEKARILRMRCSDFLWEWRLLRDAADDAAAEFMPRIATTMYAAARSEAGDYVDAKVWKAASRALKDAAKRCEDAPEQLFWEGTFRPVMDEAVPK